MLARIRSPLPSTTYSTRQADCVKAIEARFQQLHDPGQDYIDLIKEAMASGWSMREARLAINKLLGVDLKNRDDR